MPHVVVGTFICKDFVSTENLYTNCDRNFLFFRVNYVPARKVYSKSYSEPEGMWCDEFMADDDDFCEGDVR